MFLLHDNACWHLAARPGSSHYPQFSQLSVTLSRPLIATAPQQCSCAVTSPATAAHMLWATPPNITNSSSGQCRQQARTCWCSAATPDWARHQHQLQLQHAAATVLSINNLTCADIWLQQPGVQGGYRDRNPDTWTQAVSTNICVGGEG